MEGEGLMSGKQNTNHLKQEKDLLEYIEIFAGKSLDQDSKDYLRGTLNLTYGRGYNHGCEVAVKSLEERGRGHTRINFKRLDPEGLLEVAQTLEAALTADSPFVMEIKNRHGEFKQIVNREELLAHYMDWAIETLYALCDSEE